MNSTRYVLIAFKAALWLSWTSTAAAAVVVAANAPSALDLDPMLMLLVCIISTLAGATALAIRINNLLLAGEGDQAPKPFVRPWLFAAAHMGGSWMAGVAGFLLSRANAWDVWTSLLGVLVMSFGGAKVLEAFAERWLAVVRLPGEKA